MKDGFPNPAKLGKNNKLDSHIYSIKESGFESPNNRQKDDKGTLNGVNPNIFKKKEIREAEKMRMTDNLHDKRNLISKKFKKHDTMTPLTIKDISNLPGTAETQIPMKIQKKGKSKTNILSNVEKLVEEEKQNSSFGDSGSEQDFNQATELKRPTFSKLKTDSNQKLISNGDVSTKEKIEVPEVNTKGISQLQQEQDDILKNMMMVSPDMREASSDSSSSDGGDFRPMRVELEEDESAEQDQHIDEPEEEEKVEIAEVNIDKLEEEQDDLLAQMMMAPAGQIVASDSSDEDSESEPEFGVQNRFQVGGSKKYDSEVEDQEKSESPSLVPISNKNSPMIRKLEVPTLIKADDYMKDISDLKKEQDVLLAQMMMPGNGEPSDSSEEDNSNIQDDDSSNNSFSHKFMKNQKIDSPSPSPKKKLMSNLSHQNFLLDQNEDSPNPHIGSKEDMDASIDLDIHPEKPTEVVQNIQDMSIGDLEKDQEDLLKNMVTVNANMLPSSSEDSDSDLSSGRGFQRMNFLED